MTIRVIPGVLSMEESTAVASSIDVEQPGPDGACRSLPYGVIDPYAAEASAS